MGTQNTVTVFESRGVVEARKLKPKIENVKRLMIETVIEIGSKYRSLSDAEKFDFRTELGLAHSTARDYAAISERYLARVKMLPGDVTDVTPIEKSFNFAKRISAVSDEAFAHIVESGQITLASSGDHVRKVVTTLNPIKRRLAVATRAINKAARHINAIRALMEKDGVTAIRGPEVRQLREEFQLLCAELMAADPATVEQAKKVLRGEQ